MVRATHFGVLRLARLSATEEVADESIGTRRSLSSAARGASHPDFTRPMRDIIHQAALSVGTGALLAILPVDPRADRYAPLAERQAPLSLGARAALAGREAGEAIGAFGAEEALGATRGFIPLAGAATPALTEEPRLAAFLRSSGEGVTCFTFLPNSLQRAQANRGAFASKHHRSADEALRAMGVRLARAVGAVALHAPRVEETLERRFAVVAALALALVGEQASALLEGEHGNRPHPWRALLSSPGGRRVEHPGQWQWEQQADEHGYGCSPPCRHAW